jgi:cupin fold WbuC family metalloprotein
MLIVLSRESYVQPHKHLGKSESFHIIEGEVDVAIFDDAGQISDVVALGAMGTGRKFFYRLSDSRFHTLLIHSDMLVMHEVTNGPFIKEQSINASFSPSDGNPEETKIYMKNLAHKVLEWRRSRAKS